MAQKKNGQRTKAELDDGKMGPFPSHTQTFYDDFMIDCTFICHIHELPHPLRCIYAAVRRKN